MADTPKRKVSDPLQPVNRAFFAFNDKFYFWLLKPIDSGYKKIAPKPVRLSIDRLFQNARFPIRFANNLLQGQFKSTGIEVSRFVVNSTVGVGGLFDPSDHWKLKEQKADLDQTLAHYRVPTGCFICWPFIGPSSLRGTFGLAGDSMLQPWGYCSLLAVRMGVPAFDIINKSSLHPGEYEEFKNSTLDAYVAMRSAYFDNLASEK